MSVNTMLYEGTREGTAPLWYRAYKQGGIIPVMWWLDSVSQCTPVWGVCLLILVPIPLGIFPLPVRHKFCHHPSDLSGLSMVKAVQELQYFLCHEPNLTDVHLHWLWHCLIHHTTVPHSFSCLRQHPQNHTPPSLRFLQVPEFRQTVAIIIIYPSPKLR